MTTFSDLVAKAEVVATRDEAVSAVASCVSDKDFLNKGDAVKALTDSMNKPAKGGAVAREGALCVAEALVNNNGPAVEPFLVAILPKVVELQGDKVRPVALKAVTVGEAVIAAIQPNQVGAVVPLLCQKQQKWNVNVFRLESIAALIKRCPLQMQPFMGDIVTALSEAMWDLKAEVKAAAKSCMNDACESVDNKDIKPFIPKLIAAIEKPAVVPETIHALAATTFVQAVNYGALCIMAPILLRGFTERSSATKRQCARIIENMAKLVDEPRDVAPFLPKLLPKLEEAMEEVADPECREVCGKAAAILKKRGDMTKVKDVTLYGKESFEPVYTKALAKDTATAVSDYCAYISSSLIATRMLDDEDWNTALLPTMELFVSGNAKETLSNIVTEVHVDHAPIVEVEEGEEDAEELCNTNFSLAYGSKILLSNTQLRLLRGNRYGLIGQNDSGKTSLMKAIADNRVEGFPSPEEVRTIFVETDIQGELSDLSVVEYMFADELLKKMGATHEEMEKILNEVGFKDGSPANTSTSVGALSGGWKMKLALARAMLLKADILLLDEPTNHLDVHNVKWVQDYLTSLDGVTSILVSHDSKFLDIVCTHIIQISDLKLGFFKGNLSDFVVDHPEAMSYFKLKSTKQKFSFPKPGHLDGINSKGKPILKMSNITFTYPGAEKPQLKNVTVRCSLASRVACVGVNGAGKSTMIKLLTGELIPDTGSGEVWKHPNVRTAYVAQHAFHHIESHLEKTPNEYIRWRYEHGKDKEALEKITLIATEEEKEQMAKPIQIEYENDDGKIIKEKRTFSEFTEGRREGKRGDKEYEVRWNGIAEPSYVSERKLEEAGFAKLLKIVDEAIAMRAGSYLRPLSMANVEKHLEDVGLEREFGSHSRLAALSGGQKVKVVLAACTWHAPHMLILDEPTNYLDRDSLGALAGAIEEFEGGVVMITHNNEFCSSLCPETWVLENNTLNLKGDPEWMKNALKEKIVDEGGPATMTDAYGNVTKVKAKKKALSRAEKKKRDKRRAARRAQGIETDTESESE
ncbi:hypothetical protein SARC_04403 [Sphaeroforma arctica JP610]|uniref:ABC transporter domain-containing protein n=1 Tax=Sphaeroforma arctica JP610 TaxID=667725 RepID=A0A0L0G3D2_9EUKA|nr:hypothetical protein SARC_04403 [Sphaeroforma arctica JP610]KNC83351.1 hypothetical protein SARC_04403 [Sphaeroforma arctica JP610]|eukprot:XP_014157253.1 hypothetical protein SARC_04403 [Sphaeroforma arctica JP610]